jgi:subtilase family serine protease
MHISRLISRRRSLVVVIAASTLAVGGLASATAAHAATKASPRVAIAGTHPSWATTYGSKPAPAVKTGVVNARIYLAGRDQSGLTAFATEVSTPGNPLYRHYLTPAQVRARYGPTHSQIASVESWVRSAGLRVTAVNGETAGYVAVTGSVAEATRAFGVSFGSFRAPDGHMHRAPETEASAPASIASSILTISGLDTAPHLARPMLPPPEKNYWIAKPCSAYYGQKTATTEPSAYGKEQSWNLCGYTQAQIRSAYGVTTSGMTGKGQTVAIVDAYASPTMPGDANEFATMTGDKPFKPGQYKQIVPSHYTETSKHECGAAGWYGEETLDIEAAHGQAPDANIRFVAAASCEDADLASALALIVNDHIASIVSSSWGDLADQESITPVYELIFRAGAAEGIGFLFSSGDNGYESPAEDSESNELQVDYPTSSAWVTSVGGTSLAIGRKGNYQFETAWGTLLDPLSKNGKSWQDPLPGIYPEYYDGSSGGGTSTEFTQPYYQKGIVPTSLSHTLPGGAASKTAMRVVPDVSALADPSTGMLVGETVLEPNGKTYGFALSRIGGTSVSCPTFAGIEADAQQAAGYPLGFANPVIYLRYDTSAFHDVTDNPLGPGHLAQVRNNYAYPYEKKGPLITYLRTLGIDGEGSAALRATKGYDDATGVGSPYRYIESFEAT